MDKHILLVDDSAELLRTYTKCLKKLEPNWTFNTAESGDSALEILQEKPCDVILTDMNMPEMSGPDLLEQVRSEFPKTARFIHAGPADIDEALRTVNVAHQYFLKPYAPRELIGSIKNATTSENLIKTEKIRKVLLSLERIPSVPDLYTKIKEKFEDPNSNIQDIGKLIEQDPGMTSKILQLVNSAFFGHAQRITNTGEAASYLGIELIKTLVLSLHIFAEYEDVKIREFDLQRLWKYSIGVAQTARMIAQMEKTDRTIHDEAFTAGLLHDVGQLILIINFPEEYEKVCYEHQVNDMDLLDAERKIFEISHTDVGGFIMRLWGLPEEVVNTIEHHHKPSQFAKDASFSALTAVHAASMLHGNEHPIASSSSLDMIDMSYLESLKLDSHLAEWAEVSDG